MPSVAELFTSTHGKLIKLFGGTKLGGGAHPGGVIVVRHVGARSGKVRHTPLTHLPYGEGYAVVASAAGSDHNPSWFHNLVANPETTISVAGQDINVIARVTPDEERTKIMEMFVAHEPRFASYGEKTSRTLPIIVFNPH